MSERVRLARARARRSRSRRRRTARSRRFGSFRFLARAPGFPARVPQLEHDRDARAVARTPLQREVQRGGPERLEARERKHRRAETRHDFAAFPVGGSFVPHADPRHLLVHLKRFEMDYATMVARKINSRFEFPDVLDLGPYVEPESLKPPISLGLASFGLIL